MLLVPGQTCSTGAPCGRPSRPVPEWPGTRPGCKRLTHYLATAKPAGHTGGPEAWELANMALVAQVVVALAARRRESRGAHWRTDFPAQDPSWQLRQVAQLMPDGQIGVGNVAVNEPTAGERPTERLSDAVGRRTALAG